MDLKTRDILKLKAAIEFGSEHMYTVRPSGLGPSLIVKVKHKSEAPALRKRIPTEWEGLYTLVLYNSGDPDRVEDDSGEDVSLYDPELI